MISVEPKINAMHPPGAAGGVIRAYASVTVAGCVGIRGIRVIEGRDGLFVSMPSRKTGDEYKEVCFPVTKDFRQQLHSSILNAYQQAMTQKQTSPMQTQGQNNEPQPVVQMGSM